jgi:hypothetical protein
MTLKSRAGAVAGEIRSVVTSEIVNSELLSSVKPRRATWQLMMDYVRQPAEGGKRLPEIDVMFRENLWRTGVSA